MEHKCMEPEDAVNFQRLLVNRLQGMPNQNYNRYSIEPELEKPEFTIGESHSRESKSIKTCK